MKRAKEVLHELKHHTPFTLVATITATIIILILISLNQLTPQSKVNSFIYIFHPLHLFVSAIATSGMFYKYKKNFTKAILVGISGAIIIESLSDVIFPYLGGTLLNLQTEFHLPLIEEPLIVLTSVLIGSLIGIKTQATKQSHFAHVFLSVFASLFYLLAFSTIMTTSTLLLASIIVFIAVIIPCCIGDILFPFFFMGKKIKCCDCK